MFTVVIPLYNKENYIRRAVDSVLSQNLEDFELIIINDGSTDASLSKLNDINDDRLKVSTQPNKGVGEARNNGISKARFNWVALLDADDFWHTSHLSELKSIIEKFPDSGLVSTRNKIIHTESDITNVHEREKYSIVSIDYFNEASKDLTIVHSSAVCIKKSVFDTIGGFKDMKMGEDLEYWARIALRYPVAVSNKTTSYYCRGVGGVSESTTYNKYVQPKRLCDVSPSINLLVQESENDPSILKSRSVRKYINSRLASGAKSWVLNDNIIAAKNLCNLALPQLTVKYGILYSIKRSPTSFLKLAKRVYSK